MASVVQYLSMVKFSHTVFALPFAAVGLIAGIAERGVFDWKVIPLVLVCMVTARNAAMGFNRWADRRFDARNARTAVREIPAGVISPRAAFAFVVLNALVFMAATYPLNESRLCFYLSPVALLVVLGYSYTKRFTALCHLVLGLGLGLAPVGAFLAVTGYFTPYIIVLGVAVLAWVSGFDIIYALQDDQFDRAEGLHSIPSRLGRRNALLLSACLHLLAVGCVVLFGFWLQLGWLYWVAAGLFAALLAYQHTLVTPTNLSRVNLAFFTTNGIGSVLFGILTSLAIGFSR
ncbi:MAG: putative 4-hydroxybenzoate polyprenyltransferase [Bacteroidetes bacterium]|nr:putative 4-hydroxybenzoate polyprenyltransferase [Bacteroidota bacterium]